jgi:hypothetical protein
VLLAQFPQWAEGGDARLREDDVDATECAQGSVDEPVDSGLIPHVPLDDEGLRASLIDQLDRLGEVVSGRTCVRNCRDRFGDVEAGY